MKKFRLKSGKHRVRFKDGRGSQAMKIYRKGDIIESEEDLAEKDPERFERISGRTIAAEEESKEVKEKEAKGKTLVAQHRGGGKWRVYNTETNEQINEKWLTKDEAHAMVANFKEEADGA